MLKLNERINFYINNDSILFHVERFSLQELKEVKQDLIDQIKYMQNSGVDELPEYNKDFDNGFNEALKQVLEMLNNVED